MSLRNSLRDTWYGYKFPYPMSAVFGLSISLRNNYNLTVWNFLLLPKHIDIFFISTVQENSIFFQCNSLYDSDSEPVPSMVPYMT